MAKFQNIPAEERARRQSAVGGMIAKKPCTSLEIQDVTGMTKSQVYIVLKQLQAVCKQRGGTKWWAMRDSQFQRELPPYSEETAGNARLLAGWR